LLKKSVAFGKTQVIAIDFPFIHMALRFYYCLKHNAPCLNFSLSQKSGQSFILNNGKFRYLNRNVFQ